MGSLNLKIKDEIAILEFNQPDSKVNVLNTETMREFYNVISELSDKSESDVKALIITSGKDDIFIAGADIKEIENITSSEEARDKAEKGKQVLDKLDSLNLVTVAAINGACLGGGLELALACKYRVATFSEKVIIGLPEVKLGIIPGFCGTQRLPRLIGLSRALGMILPGKTVSGREALKYGLLDRLLPRAGFIEETLRFARDILEGKARIRRKKKKKLIEIILECTPLGRAIVFNEARKNVLKATKGFYPAAIKAIELIRKTYGGDIKKGSRLESEIFGELAISQTSKNLIKVFYLIEEFKKFPWVDKSLKPAQIRKCGIVGAGVMGGGIAQLVSFKDIPTRIKDINYEALKKALKTAYGLFGYAIKKRKLKKHQAEYKFGLISPTISYAGFENADLIIEAVVENLDIKKKVFRELCAIASSNTVFASNTSSLPIIKISETAHAPDRIVGLHFFNPVHRMPLVEVIKSEKTSEQTLATVIAFARGLGKTVIVVKDVVGFLINRILLPYLNEAGFLAEEGVGIRRIDKIAVSFGMPIGPVELIDEIGIDVGYKVAKILEEAYGSRMRVSPALEKAKEKGLLGRKSKRGFYIHKGKKKKVPNPEICDIVNISSKSQSDDETILKRMIYLMINEAALCLEEDVADRPETIDIGMIMGTGFPPFRAGLLRYADAVGIENIVNDLKFFENKYKSERFRPCKYLVDKAERKENFYG